MHRLAPYLVVLAMTIGCSKAPEPGRPPGVPPVLTSAEPKQPRPKVGDRLTKHVQFPANIWDDLEMMRRSDREYPTHTDADLDKPEFRAIFSHRVNTFWMGDEIEVIGVGPDYAEVRVLHRDIPRDDKPLGKGFTPAWWTEGG